jgi:hypothetical protein
MRWALAVVVTISGLGCVASARAAGPIANAPPPGTLSGLFDLDGSGWSSSRISAEAFMQEQQEKRLGIAHSMPGGRQPPVEGFHFDITGKLLGALQYHWKAGERPELGLKGIPIRAKIKTNGVYFGFSYRP